jgi:hypothetical protein
MLRTSFCILAAAAVVAVGPTFASVQPAGARSATPSLSTRPPPPPPGPYGGCGGCGGGGIAGGHGHFIATHR